jgi:hypothetical protein
MANLKTVILILFVVLILVIAKLVGKSGFKQDAADVVEAVSSENYMVLANDLKNAETQYLVVELNESSSPQFENSIHITFEKLLNESTLQKLKDTGNKILLVSADNSTAAKAWAILNQLNFKNVFVLSSEENPEVLKYEFQPGTAAKLESNSE